MGLTTETVIEGLEDRDCRAFEVPDRGKASPPSGGCGAPRKFYC
jgi:hypothetical protein